jgi:hypothetical protein
MPTGTNFDILLGFMHYYDKKIYNVQLKAQPGGA